MNAIQSYIEKKANSLTKDYNVPYVKTYKIATDLNYKIKIADLNTQKETYLAYTDFENKTIYVNKNNTKPLMLFGIATQIGWITLFPKSKHYKPLKNKKTPPTHQDNSILIFTQHLLLPTHLFKGAENYPEKILKEIFQTPEFLCALRKQNFQNAKNISRDKNPR